MNVLPNPRLGVDAGSANVLPLAEGVTATVTRDEEKGWVYLSIVDKTRGVPLTLEIPSQYASDLAVALVNAANGL